MLNKLCISESFAFFRMGNLWLLLCNRRTLLFNSCCLIGLARKISYLSLLSLHILHNLFCNHVSADCFSQGLIDHSTEAAISNVWHPSYSLEFRNTATWLQSPKISCKFIDSHGLNLRFHQGAHHISCPRICSRLRSNILLLQNLLCQRILIRITWTYLNLFDLSSFFWIKDICERPLLTVFFVFV